jgi:hypothetical protein
MNLTAKVLQATKERKSDAESIEVLTGSDSFY